MHEFMLLIRNEINHQARWSSDRHQRFLKACEGYIRDLKKDGNLLSAQPMVRQGTMLAKVTGQWKQSAFHAGKDVIVGYYHVLANDLDDAIAIAQRNPEFEFSDTARIEVRPIKMKEETTGFVYPDKQ